ncbi:exodeoxyribonuclease III [Desulfococcus sp.]|uniref:exodeoxyribonuclease III n=1 Tax=Desulfococcus sp. TaxID=2025834 RepID=UPI003594597B
MAVLKLISWNVNGLRAVWNKDFPAIFRGLDPDLLAIQETKLQASQLTDEMRHIEGYESWWSFSTVKKGYSGVGVYTRIPPVRVREGIGIPRYDDEGRILELDFGDFVFFNVYFPNGQMSDERLRYKLDFYRDFFDYLAPLKSAGRNLIIAGDYNTAHNEIDLKNPKANENTSGFLRVERDRIDEIIRGGYVDTFRHLHPETVEYSWWSYRFKARERNAGWRIDYFFTTENMIASGRIQGAAIDNSVFGSDHCPIRLTVLR